MGSGWKDKKNWLLVIGSVLFTLIVMEVALRLVMASDRKLLYNHLQDCAFLGKNKYWKFWRHPNNTVNHSSDCFDAIYETNSLGFKADELDTARPVIALLGDSYVEGYGVSNRQSVPYLLDSIMNHKYQILPLAVSGGIGTVHQYSMYRNFGKFFEPKLVVLCWLNYNDLYDNLNAIKEGFVDPSGKVIFPVSNSLQETLSEIQQMPPPKVIDKTPLMYSFSLAARGYRFLQQISQYSTNVKGNFKNAIAEVFAEQENTKIEEAWQLTEQVIDDLNQEVSGDGSKLIVVNLFDPYQVDANWQEAMSRKLGKPLSASHPNDRLQAICASLDIPYYSMLEPTLSEIEARDMSFPYFNFACDNHLTPEGNLWTARLIARYLADQNLR